MSLASIQLSKSQRIFALAGLSIACILVISATAYRSVTKYHVPSFGELDKSKLGLFDFHNGIYYPAVGLTQGFDPYGPAFAAAFPVTRQIPPYSPLALVLHWPLGWMPIHVAEVVYYVVTILLLGLLGVMCVDRIAGVQERAVWMLLAVLLVFASRSGHTTLFTAYFTTELVLGTLIALRYAEERPMVSGLGVALASIKPNFGIPLVLLLAARGNWKATVWGVVLSVVGALVGVAILLQHVDLPTLIADVQSSDSAHVTDEYELPVNTWTRIDIVAVVAKWANWNPDAKISLAIMLGLLVLPYWALRCLRKQGDLSGDQSYSGVLMLAVGASVIYHHAYDALLLIPAAFSLVLDDRWRVWFSQSLRYGLAAGLLFVPWNYLSSEMVLNRLDLPGGHFRQRPAPVDLFCWSVVSCLFWERCGRLARATMCQVLHQNNGQNGGFRAQRRPTIACSNCEPSVIIRERSAFPLLTEASITEFLPTTIHDQSKSIIDQS